MNMEQAEDKRIIEGSQAGILENSLLTRRSFLTEAAGILASMGALLVPGMAAAGKASQFVYTLLKYRGGKYNPRPKAPRRLLWELAKRTSIDGERTVREVRILDAQLFRSPFLFMSGDRAFPPFSDKELRRLRRFLTAGGFLFADSAEGRANGGFYQSFKREMTRLFPRQKLTKVPPKHTVFQSFYLFNRVPGRVAVSPHLLHIDRNDRSLVLYCDNDLAGAYARDAYGRYLYPSPRGERERELALRMSVNVVFYGLCVNYKRDQVHVPFILKRRR